LAQKDAQRYEAEIQAQGGPQTMKKKRRAKKDPGVCFKAGSIVKLLNLGTQTCSICFLSIFK
jgi:hypothetical protein